MAHHLIKPARGDADVTLPRPPSAAQIREFVAARSTPTDLEPKVKAEAAERLRPYVLRAELPSSAAAIDKELARWRGLAPADVRTVMRTIYQVKPAFMVPKFGERKRTSVNAYVSLVDGSASAMELKPELL